MPDLTIEHSYCCEQVRQRNNRGEFPDLMDDECCTWIEAYSDVAYRGDEKCPKCGGPVSVLAIAV